MFPGRIKDKPVPERCVRQIPFVKVVKLVPACQVEEGRGLFRFIENVACDGLSMGGIPFSC